MFETSAGGDAMVLLPWGPIALWGSTETAIERADDGFTASAEEVRFLLDELNRHVADAVKPEDIVSIRCGVRPLAVRRAEVWAGGNPVRVSRRPRVFAHPRMPWISVYGGKFTDGPLLGREVARLLARMLGPTRARFRGEAVNGNGRSEGGPGVGAFERFPGLEEPVPDPAWCARHEMCWTLEDYLRRRTDVAQWVPRGGLGRDGENAAHLRAIALRIADGDEQTASRQVMEYEAGVRRQFDAVVAAAGVASV